jgi:hypothetical protein
MWELWGELKWGIGSPDFNFDCGSESEDALADRVASLSDE